MKEITKKAIAEYKKAVAKQNGVEDPTEKFNVSASATQKIIAAARESNWLLGKINVIPVKNQNGEALQISVTGMIAGRTNTKEGNKRKTRSVHSMKPMPYFCVQTNFDTHIRYEKLDAFSHLKNFSKMISNQTREQIGANKCSIAFYGTSCAVDTDPVENPNGEDVNKGWIQALREHNPYAVLKEGATKGEIRIGEGGDFINLDLAVMNVKGLLGDACINSPNLVAIIGTDLLSYDKAKFYAANGNKASEKALIEDMQVIGTYGSLPAVAVPGFPPTGILVSSFNNLSIYIQEGTIRRSVGKKNDELDQLETFESMNMAYVVEQLDKAACIEFDNVRLLINGEWH